MEIEISWKNLRMSEFSSTKFRKYFPKLIFPYDPKKIFQILLLIGFSGFGRFSVEKITLRPKSRNPFLAGGLLPDFSPRPLIFGPKSWNVEFFFDRKKYFFDQKQKDIDQKKYSKFFYQLFSRLRPAKPSKNPLYCIFTRFYHVIIMTPTTENKWKNRVFRGSKNILNSFTDFFQSNRKNHSRRG